MKKMTRNMNYQPEDIEALLMEKSFIELYAEEKKFVLEHLASASEYEQMRETLLSIQGGAGKSGHDEWRPSPRVREALMREFEKEKRRGAVIWWNGVGLWFRDTLRFDLPVVRYGFAVLVVAAGLFFFLHKDTSSVPGKELAVTHKKDSNPAASTVTGGIHAVPPNQGAPVQNNIANAPGKQTAPSPAKDNTVPPQHRSNPGRQVNVVASHDEPRVVQQQPPPQPPGMLDSDRGASSAYVAGGTGNDSVLTTNIAQNNTATNTDGTAVNGIRQDDSVQYIVPGVQTTATCAGSSVLLSNGGTAAYSYNWSPSFSSLGTTAVIHNATTYAITVTDANGVSAPGVITVRAAKSRSLASDSDVISTFCELK